MQRIPVHPRRAAPERRPVLAAPDHHDARPPAHPGPAQRTPLHGGLARRARRLRRVRLDQPVRGRGHPQGRLETGRGIRQRRRDGLVPGNARLVRPHPRRLPRRPRRRRHRPRRSPAAPAPPSSSTHRRPKPGQGSATAARSKSHSTRAARSWSSCPTRRTWTTTSPSTRPSGTSTPWTATASSAAPTPPAPRTSSPSPTPATFSAGIDSTGFERTPMRNAEARITLGVISARQGDLEQALDYGRRPSPANACPCPACSWSPANSAPSSPTATPRLRRHRLPRPAQATPPPHRLTSVSPHSRAERHHVSTVLANVPAHHPLPRGNDERTEMGQQEQPAPTSYRDHLRQAAAGKAGQFVDELIAKHGIATIMLLRTSFDLGPPVRTTESEAIARVEAARELELAAHQIQRHYIRQARETGSTWYTIGRAPRPLLAIHRQQRIHRRRSLRLRPHLRRQLQPTRPLHLDLQHLPPTHHRPRPMAPTPQTRRRPRHRLPAPEPRTRSLAASQPRPALTKKMSCRATAGSRFQRARVLMDALQRRCRSTLGSLSAF